MRVRLIQQKLRRSAKDRNWDKFHNPKNLATALVCEAAELAELFQWLTPAEAARCMRNAQTAALRRQELADVRRGAQPSKGKDGFQQLAEAFMAAARIKRRLVFDAKGEPVGTEPVEEFEHVRHRVPPLAAGGASCPESRALLDVPPATSLAKHASAGGGL